MFGDDLPTLIPYRGVDCMLDAGTLTYNLPHRLPAGGRIFKPLRRELPII